MNRYISYNGYEIEILVKPKIKHSYISIDRDKKLVVKTPNSSIGFIHNLIDEKSSWIDKQLKRVDDFKLIGKDELYSVEFIENRVNHFSKLMDLKFKRLKFRKMKSRWGSCNSKSEITLNSELTRVDKELIDYVIVHELAHIKHMNHSKEFHNLVENYLPMSKTYRDRLKNIRLT